MFIRAYKGLPYGNMAQKYPKIENKITDFFMCKQFNVLPEEGGLRDQYLEDYVYFKLFASISNELSQQE